jgi:hypothetical protein
MLVAHGAFTLSRIGMAEDVFVRPTSLDCSFIFAAKRDTDSFLSPEFFARDLWPDGMPFALERIIIKEWKDKLRTLGLSGFVASYEQCVHGMHLSQKHAPSNKGDKTVINNVTVNLGSGASFTGPFAVGENIKIAYANASGVPKNELKERLQDTVKVVGQLAEQLEDEQEKIDVSSQLKAFVEEAPKEQPSKWMLENTAKGILEVASKVAAMVTPVSNAVKAVMTLVSP